MKRNKLAVLASALIITGLLSPAGSGAASAEPVQSKPAAVAEGTAPLQTGVSAAVSLKAFTDVKAEYWAAQAIDRWSRSGVISGYGDNTFRPDLQVTRAEFAAIVNRIFGYKDTAAALPSDIPSTAWYKNDIAKAAAAGYLSAGEDGQIRPAAQLTRGEAVVALQKIARLEAGNQAQTGYSDLAGAGSEVIAAAAALTAGGYIQGYPGGLFKPDGRITRAELAKITDLLVKELKSSAGEAVLGTVQGNLVLNHEGITLKNSVIEGNLYLTEGIGEGNITLDNVEVKGTTFIRGGGEHSVSLNNSTLNSVQVAKPGSPVRIVASGTTRVGTVQLNSAASLEEAGLTGEGFGNVELSLRDKLVSLKGNFGVVATSDTASGVTLNFSGKLSKLVWGTSGKIELLDKAQIAELLIKAGAKGLTIQGSGSFGLVDNQAEGVTAGAIALKQGSHSNLNPAAPLAGQAPAAGGGETPATAAPTPTPAPTAAPTPVPTPVPTATPAGEMWSLVWNDEFNDNSIDPAKWTYDLGDGMAVGNPGWGNNELEWYTSDAKNVKEQDGKLIITAHKEAVGGKEYTSTRIKTKGLYSKKYGKFEIRAKAPTGKGLWPAIWMLPENYEYGNWAASGELDIMEGWGSRPHEVAGTIHYGSQWPNNTLSSTEYVLPDNSTIADYHTYSIEWEPGEIRWYVDGILFSTKNDWYSFSSGMPAMNAYPAPFNQKFHLLMNLAVGGNFDGNPTEDTVFPSSMEIDYVRIYELTGREYREPVPVQFEKEPYLEGAKLPLADGNFIHNSGFTETVEGDAGMGIPDTAHWVLYKDEGANAALTLEPLEGSNFLKVNISSPGGNSYSIQPQSIVSVAKGRYYKLSFDAKTDTARNIAVRLTGGAQLNWPAYSPAFKADLTSQLQHYETMFQMKADSDNAARIEFNMGTNASPVWLGNARLEEIDSIPLDHDGAKTPLGSGNHLYNGSFDLGEADGRSYWHFAGTGGAEVSPSVKEGILKLNIAGTGGKDADVTMLQKGIFLVQGHDYRLTFNADSSSARTAVAELRGSNGSVYASETIQLAAGEHEAEAVFKNLAGATDRMGQFVLRLGGTAGTVVLDQLLLVRTSFYYDPDIDYYPLKNGDFSNSFSSWERLVTEDGGQSTASAADGAAKFHITNTGNQAYSVMLFQNGLKTAAGSKYIIGFDASSSVARDISVKAENGDNSPSYSTIVKLSPDKAHYEFEFTQLTKDTLSLKFLLGKVENVSILQAHDIVIDNVNFEVKDAPAKPQELIADSTNNRVSQQIGLTFAEKAEWSGKIKTVKVNGTALTEEQYDIGTGSILIHASVFPVEDSYKITVEADGYVGSSVEQFVLANDDNLVFNSSFNAGNAGWSIWSNTAPASTFKVTEGAAEIGIAAAGSDTWSTQFFQEKIKLEAGKTYELSFKAKSTVPRQIIVEYSGTSAATPAKFDITATWATYSAQFTVTNDSPLKLNYLIGKTLGNDGTANTTPHVISLDDIVIREVTGGPVIDPPSGRLDNGTFDAEPALKGWEQYFDGPGSAAVKNGELEVSLNFTGGNNFSAQVDYRNLKLVQGKSYTLTFKARSTINRLIELAVEHYDEGWTKHFVPAEAIALTDAMQTFSYTFTMNNATDAGAHLVYLMGKIAGNSAETNTAIEAGNLICIDDVSLVENP
ncbi:carbohydrate binding domain-containing protein [Paenibacillus sp. MMS20-IR301]|uniref:carbohydrate binding domain-containing protein n=1 Tax=Paenibacillus sp. MMS20-IR301 TaxID=2895946 RepID=UPI0028F0F349|nr:carbohydrate binding domain-containing protein [Paenibacillus sp. MMS20-IR301]WNS43207.1 carbohydrate binding domain-containing protein [Paenibacillus sp. MMS20-IR301]